MGLFGRKRKYDPDEEVMKIVDRLGSRLGLRGREQFFLGSTPSLQGVALQVAAMGAYLYVELENAETFPSGDPAISKLGSEGVRASLRTVTAEEAAIFMGHVLPRFLSARWDNYWTYDRQEKNPPASDRDGLAINAMNSAFPLNEEWSQWAEEAVLGYEVFENDELGSGIYGYVAMRWVMALDKGENPRENPEEVELQQRSAHTWATEYARIRAIQIGLPDLYPRISDSLSRPTQMQELDAMVNGLAVKSFWNGIIEEYADRMDRFRGADGEFLELEARV